MAAPETPVEAAVPAEVKEVAKPPAAEAAPVVEKAASAKPAEVPVTKAAEDPVAQPAEKPAAETVTKAPAKSADDFVVETAKVTVKAP